jgi:hypothetical protein
LRASGASRSRRCAGRTSSPGADPRLPRFRDRDTVRLEVAYIGGRELFPYPGADEIAETEVSRLAPDGPIGG